DPGAKEGRRLYIAERFRQFVYKVFGRPNVFRITPISAVSGEFGALAQILCSAPAIDTNPACAVQPGYSNARSDGKARRVLPLCFNITYNLVTGDYRTQPRGEFALYHVEVSAADTA